MPAQVFYLPFPTAFTSNGAPAAGAKLYFYEPGTLTPKDVFTTAVLDVEHPHPITADGAGRFPNVYLDTAETYRVRIKSRTGTVLADVDNLIPGTVAGSDLVAPYATNAAASASEAAASAALAAEEADRAETAEDGAAAIQVAILEELAGTSLSTVTLEAENRVILAALDNTLGIPAYLTETGREGFFVWDGSNLSAAVTADPMQAFYVPETAGNGTTGAWVRRYAGPKIATWFGAAGNGVSDDGPELQAWLDSGGWLKLPAGEYYSAQQLILRKVAIIEGDGFGYDNRDPDLDDWPGSRIRFPAGVGGLDIQPQQTQTDIATVLANIPASRVQEGSHRCVIRDLALIGVNSGAAAVGVKTRIVCYLDNVQVYRFSGKGFDIVATSTAPDGNEYGNANVSTLTRCKAISCGSHGFHIRGADANVIKLDTCDATENGGWGFLDAGFLGNTYINTHAATNTSGSFKASNVNALHTYIGCYVETGTGETCDLGPQCQVVGGNLSTAAISANTRTNGYPNVLANGNASLGQVVLSAFQSVPGAITQKALIYRGSDRGLVLQGAPNIGGTYDLMLVNKDDEIVIQVGSGTQNVQMLGDASVAGALGVTGSLNVGGAYSVDGVQVVTNRQAAVSTAGNAAGATPTQAEFNGLVAIVNAILTHLRTHGLIST